VREKGRASERGEGEIEDRRAEEKEKYRGLRLHELYVRVRKREEAEENIGESERALSILREERMHAYLGVFYILF
jgi:hypothetical protein